MQRFFPYRHLRAVLAWLPLTAALAGLCGGCALLQSHHQHPAQVAITPDITVGLPATRALDLSLSATQLLHARYRLNNETRNRSAEIHIEAAPDKLVMVATGGWGSQVFSIVYQNRQIQTTSLPMAEAGPGVRHVLLDFILTYASPQVIHSMLADTAIHYKLTGTSRHFYHNSQEIITITYQHSNPWQGKLRLVNHVFHYTITIETVRYQPAS